MAYEKYNITDDAQGNLDVGISASATTLNLESWDGALFPTTNFILKLVQYTTTSDPTTEIVKTEDILVTNRSGDVLTVTRGFDSSTPASFDAGDFLYLTNHTAIIKDIQDEVTRLESDKLDNNELRTGIGNWKVIYTNASWNEVVLGLWSANTYLQSNGTTSAPSWATPPLDIFWQTTVSTIDRANDYIAISDASSSNSTRKVLINKIADNASTTSAGLVERATDWEADLGTDTTRHVTPNQLRQYAWERPWTTTTVDTKIFNNISSPTKQTYTASWVWSLRVDYSYQVTSWGLGNIVVACGIGDVVDLDRSFGTNNPWTYLHYFKARRDNWDGAVTGTFYIPIFESVPITFYVDCDTFASATFTTKKG